MPIYDAYVFTNLRQCGAAFELAARLLKWLEDETGTNWQEPVRYFKGISSTCKQLLMKLARIANGKPPEDFSEPLETMARFWQLGFAELDARLDSD